MIIRLLFIILLFSACSYNPAIVSYEDNNNQRHFVKTSDVHSFFKGYALADKNIKTNGIEWYKEVITDHFVVADLIYFEVISSDYTNSEEFINESGLYSNKAYYLTLYDKGKGLYSHDAEKYAFDVVQLRQILIKIYNYPDQDIIRENSGKLLSHLSGSKNIKAEFCKAAAEYSDDKATASSGGYIGYIPRGVTARPFDDAVFSAKKPGLITNLIETPYGIYIIYVESTSEKKTIPELRKLERNVSFFPLTLNLCDQSYNVYEFPGFYSNLFEINIAGQGIKVSNQTYNIGNIPGDLPLLKIYDSIYNWSQILAYLNIFNRELKPSQNIQEFENKIDAFSNTMIFTSRAQKDKYERTAQFRKDMDKAAEKLLKIDLAVSMEQEIQNAAKSSITELDISNYYISNPDSFIITNSKGKKFSIDYKPASKSIYEILQREQMKAIYKKWKEAKLKKYRAQYNDQAIFTLMQNLTNS